MNKPHPWNISLCVVAVICIMICYGIYAITNPHVNGMIFGSVLATIGTIVGGVLGFNLGWFRPPPQQ